MKCIPLIFAFGAAAMSASAVAKNDYPTIEVVGYVLECMQQNGGQTLETMYSCTCRFDKLASFVPFDEYETAKTQQRFQSMPGEKGGVFRDSDSGRELVKSFEKKMEEVNKSCPVVGHSGVSDRTDPR